MTQSQVISYTYPGAVWPKGTGPAVLSWTNAFLGIPVPQHLSGQTSVQSFLYPGALQPPPPAPPATVPFSFTQAGFHIIKKYEMIGY
jgi:hypothetical protein